MQVESEVELESGINLSSTHDMSDCNELPGTMLRQFLNDKAKEDETIVNVSYINALIEKRVRIKMSVKSAQSCMQLMLITYSTTLLSHCLKWLIKSKLEMAVGHLFTAIKPWQLRVPLQLDRHLAHRELCKDFKMLHRIRSELLESV